MVNFTLFYLPIHLVAFYKKNNQGKQDIFTAIGLFSNESGKSGRNGKSDKYIFRKKWAQSASNYIIILFRKLFILAIQQQQQDCLNQLSKVLMC